MKKSKKLFLIIALLFFGAIAYLGYDISKKTTFPGSKPQLKERIIREYGDSTAADTIIRQASPP